MREIIRDAFLSIRRERSPDFVIADPGLNQEFLRECRSLGLPDSPLRINLCLLNLRKSGDLKGVKSRKTVVKNQDEYRFASEIAVRFLERKYQVSLDAILCDPDLASEFDAIATQLAPGFTVFQYRWSALNLRKKSCLRPEILGRVVRVDSIEVRAVKELKLEQLPTRPGLCLFFTPNAVLYVGECRDLRKRLGKHLDHSDNKGLARWLWEHGNVDLHVEYHVLPNGLTTREHKAMEVELIRSRNPLFNIAGVD